MKLHFRNSTALAALAASIFLISTVFAEGAGGGGSSPPPSQPNISPSSSPSSGGGSGCSGDTWTCTEWSACQFDVKQRRQCSISNDCPGVVTPQPKEEQVCNGLKCAQLPTLLERVSCRLNLSKEDIETENRILYLPEYCRAEADQKEREECLALYISFQPCWKIAWLPPNGAEREQCARNVLKLPAASEAKNFCLKKKRPLRAACRNEVKGKQEKLILFKMYEFSRRAENLLSSGRTTLDTVAAFDVLVETKKQELEKHSTVAEWNSLLGEIKNAWEKLNWR